MEERVDVMGNQANLEKPVDLLSHGNSLGRFCLNLFLTHMCH